MDDYTFHLDLCLMNKILLFLILLIVIKIFYKFFFSGVNHNESTTAQKVQVIHEESTQMIPNGWLPIIESRELKTNQIKSVLFAGSQLVVFRGRSGNVHVLDAYCPHLGANIGIGGQVIGDSIRCPFHGWLFNSDGKCTEVHGLDGSDIPKAEIKVWNSTEVNGFVLVWYHIDGHKPEWHLRPFTEIKELNLKYKGRTEFDINCHLQEIVENGADGMHFGPMHSDMEFLGVIKNRKCYHAIINKIIHSEFIDLKWQASDAPNQHCARSVANIVLKLFGYTTNRLTLQVEAVGLAHGYTMFTTNTIFGQIKVILVQGIIPLAARQIRLISHIYTSPYVPWIFTYLLQCLISVQLRRDMMVWNNKKFLKKPYLAKNESNLARFRRWTTQFYSNNCALGGDRQSSDDKREE